MTDNQRAAIVAVERQETQKGECASVFAWGICKYAGDVITHGSFVIQHICDAPDNFYYQCPYSASNNLMIGVYDPTEID